MKKKFILLVLIAVLTISCKCEKAYIYQESNNDKSISLIIKGNKILCPIELCGKQTITLNDSIIDVNEEYYFLDSTNTACYIDNIKNCIKNNEGENLFFIELFDESLCILVSAVSGKTYEFIRCKDKL